MKFLLIKHLGSKLRRLARSLHEAQACPDDAWAASLLEPGEAQVYQAMDARDREHACRVTRHLLAEHPQSRPELVAAALLHDCGKSVRPYRLSERVLTGLVPQRWCVALPFVGALAVRGSHPALGAHLILRAGGRRRVASLVAQHHTPRPRAGLGAAKREADDEEALLLHDYDNRE